jgi:hypothetical protein
MTINVRDFIIRKLGGVPTHEWAAADHARQIAEEQRDDAKTELHMLQDAEEYAAGQQDQRESALNATIERYESWAREHGHELPPDTDAIWETLYGYAKHVTQGSSV